MIQCFQELGTERFWGSKRPSFQGAVEDPRLGSSVRTPHPSLEEAEDGWLHPDPGVPGTSITCSPVDSALGSAGLPSPADLLGARVPRELPRRNWERRRGRVGRAEAALRPPSPDTAGQAVHYQCLPWASRTSVHPSDRSGEAR